MNQAKQEKEREFSCTLFQSKVKIYEDLLETIFKADDDNRIDKEEVQSVENQIGVACLVANEELVSMFAQFTYQFKVYGVLYFRSMTETQRVHFTDFVTQEKAKSRDDSCLASSKYGMTSDPTSDVISYFVSLDDLMQGIRNDLDVVEGDIKRRVEHFVKIGYDHFKIMKNPNIVD